MNKEERAEHLKQKLEAMLSYERALWEKGTLYIGGVDEVGRGPLAGPVCAACVVLPRDFDVVGVDDSKKLSEKKRERLFDDIIAAAKSWCIASADAVEIDTLNILQASLLAMRRAVEGLSETPGLLLVDGNADPYAKVPAKIPVRTIVGGDAVSAAIAAASILAKVARDRHMLELAALYPRYRFEQHKGYPTKLHYEMLQIYGSSPVHRESFLRKWRSQ